MGAGERSKNCGAAEQEERPVDVRKSFGLLAPADEFTQASNNGERIDLVFPGDRIDSSELAIRIDTPDSQHAETVFALESLR